MYAILCIVVTRRGGQPFSAVGDKQAQSQTGGVSTYMHISTYAKYRSPTKVKCAQN